MLLYTTTRYLPIFFVGGTKDTKYEPGNIFYKEYRDMKEGYEVEEFFDWEDYGTQLTHVFQEKIKNFNWSKYGLDYIENITIIDFEIDDNTIPCFHLMINTSLTSEKILSILKEMGESEWMKDYYKSILRIRLIDDVINKLHHRMNSASKEVCMKAWADFIIMYETYKAKCTPIVFSRINGDINEMIKGYEFAYPSGCVTKRTIPEEAKYYLVHRYEGDLLYHKAKDVLGWNAWPEKPGSDHLLEFFHWCMKKGYKTMEEVNELINNNIKED